MEQNKDFICNTIACMHNNNAGLHLPSTHEYKIFRTCVEGYYTVDGNTTDTNIHTPYMMAMCVCVLGLGRLKKRIVYWNISPRQRVNEL